MFHFRDNFSSPHALKKEHDTVTLGSGALVSCFFLLLLLLLFFFLFFFFRTRMAEMALLIHFFSVGEVPVLFYGQTLSL